MHTTEEHSYHNGHPKNLFLERDFWFRILGYMKRDVFSFFSFVQHLGGILCATILGISLFLLEFIPIKKFVVYGIWAPLLLFLTVEYLTLLPTFFFFGFLVLKHKYAIAILSFVVPMSFLWLLLV